MIVLKATQDKVLAVLQSVAGIVERRHTLPILANVLIRKTGSQLQLTTSDLEIQIRTTAELDGDAGSFTTTVGARKLIDILRTMPSDQTVSLESQPEQAGPQRRQEQVHAADAARRRLPPGAGSASFGPSFSVPQKTLKDLLNQVSVCDGGARHPLLPQRHPVCGRRQAAEPGGHRRAPPGVCVATLDVEVPKQEVILPRKTVLEMQRLLSDKEGSDRDAVRHQPGQVQL
jgi:DNA polymerase-3 subunit beta